MTPGDVIGQTKSGMGVVVGRGNGFNEGGRRAGFDVRFNPFSRSLGLSSPDGRNDGIPPIPITSLLMRCCGVMTGLLWSGP